MYLYIKKISLLFKKSKGFTLLEILLVLAIIAILTAVVIPISQTVFTQSNLTISAQNIQSDLNRAYTYARAGKNDSDWGVHIGLKEEGAISNCGGNNGGLQLLLNSSREILKTKKALAALGQGGGIGSINSIFSVTLFSGSEYDPANTNCLNETYDLPPNITLGGTLSGQNINGDVFISDVVFTKGSGTPSIPNLTDTITLTSEQGIVKILTINSKGVVNLKDGVITPTFTFDPNWQNNTELNQPFNIATDSSHNVYVVDRLNNLIQKFDSSGTFITSWGGDAGIGSLNRPQGIAIDSANNIYVVDTFNNRIQKFDSSGNFITSWGSSGIGEGEFSRPSGIAIDSNNNIYVGDSGNNRVQKFDSSGTYITQFSYGCLSDLRMKKFNSLFAFFSEYNLGFLNFNIPKAEAFSALISAYGNLALDSANNVYVVASSSCINKFTSSGSPLGELNNLAQDGEESILLSGITMDSSNNLYVTDLANNNIKMFSPSGTFITSWGTYGSGENEFNSPRGIAFDPASTIYVADTGNNRIQKFTKGSSGGLPIGNINNTFTLTYSAGAKGSISGTTRQTVNSGADGISVFAVANSGYHFISWSDSVTDNPRTDTNVNHDISVSATFVADQQFTLAYTAGANGSISGTTPQTVNSGGDGTAITAVPDEGYRFVNWSDGSTSNPRTDTNIVSDIFVVANFSQYTNAYIQSITAALVPICPFETTTISANGVLGTNAVMTWWTGSGGTGTNLGHLNPLTVGPGTYYARVTADYGVPVESSITVSTKPANLCNHTLTYTAGANGRVTGTTPQIVTHGTGGTAVNAIPDSCYTFVSWSDGSTSNPRTDTNVVGNISVTANFSMINSFAGGSGTTEDPFQVANANQLNAINNSCFLHLKFIQTADIDMNIAPYNTGAGFTPIGFTPIEGSVYFYGTYNGNGYKISNLYINSPQMYPVGLFNVISGAMLSNIKLQNVDITGYQDVGGLVGINDSSSLISNSYSTGVVRGGVQVGGLVGLNRATISNSYSRVNVTATTSENSYSGGLIGGSYGSSSVSNSYSTGVVIGDAYWAHGFIGINSGGSASNNFYDLNTSGHSDESGATPETTSWMKNAQNFIDNGWNFSTIWDINGAINNGYPFLR